MPPTSGRSRPVKRQTPPARIAGRATRVVLVFSPARSNTRDAVVGMYEFIARQPTWEVVHIEPSDRLRFDLNALKRVDGLILAGYEQQADWAISAARRWKSVAVLRQPWRGHNVVTVDERALVSMTLDEFASMGLRHVGFFSHSENERGKAFADEATRRGISPHVFSHRPLSIADYWPQRHEVAGNWLKSLPKPTGILVHSAGQAQALCAAAVLAGVHVPEHVAILAAEAAGEACLMSRPTLSSITGMERRIGFEAARMLDRLLRGEPAGGPIEIAPTVIERRGSTDILAVTDPDLAQAIRLLRAGATEDQTIDQVLRKVPLSRNQLEHGMRKALGRSPYEEVMRVRIETACRLLRDSAMGLAEVAVHSGLGTISNFCKVFHRKVGCTPRQYRMRLSD